MVVLKILDNQRENHGEERKEKKRLLAPN